MKKEFSALSFVFQKLSVKVHKDFAAKAPQQMTLEIARAGRAVQTATCDVLEIDGQLVCTWSEEEASGEYRTPTPDPYTPPPDTCNPDLDLNF